MRLVLQESAVIEDWNPGEKFDKSTPFSFKVALVDGATFPSLQGENTIDMVAGAEHTILVRYIRLKK